LRKYPRNRWDLSFTVFEDAALGLSFSLQVGATSQSATPGKDATQAVVSGGSHTGEALACAFRAIYDKNPVVDDEG
jgi:hypothetical protein